MQTLQLQLPQELVNNLADLKAELKDLKKHFQPITPTEYLTRVEVSKMLKIDLSSVHNWTKKGTLTAYQIGGRVYYKRSEVEASIVKLKN